MLIAYYYIKSVDLLSWDIVQLLMFEYDHFFDKGPWFVPYPQKQIYRFYKGKKDPTFF